MIATNGSHFGIGIPLLFITLASLGINFYYQSFYPFLILGSGILIFYGAERVLGATPKKNSNLYWGAFILLEFTIFIYFFSTFLNLQSGFSI